MAKVAEAAVMMNLEAATGKSEAQACAQQCATGGGPTGGQLSSWQMMRGAYGGVSNGGGLSVKEKANLVF